MHALAEIADALPWPVRIAGEARGAALPAGVEALGRLSRAALREVMARAAIFVHVPRYEPFGLAPLEAAASGCALVLSDIPSLRSRWSGAALHVGPDDRDGLAQAILSLIERADRRSRLGEQALERGRCFDAERMTASYLDLYREVRGERELPEGAVAIGEGGSEEVLP
ncbi:MAG: glycosyltransferase family 4 protein [Sandaracinaceae bacterium]|nr:glycosyltransferase family 4 protein [Sandaracinaceae bacterium]